MPGMAKCEYRCRRACHGAEIRAACRHRRWAPPSHAIQCWSSRLRALREDRRQEKGPVVAVVSRGTSLRNRIEAVAAPGTAARESFQGQEGAPDCSVPLDGLICIV